MSHQPLLSLNETWQCAGLFQAVVDWEHTSRVNLFVLQVPESKGQREPRGAAAVARHPCQQCGWHHQPGSGECVETREEVAWNGCCMGITLLN